MPTICLLLYQYSVVFIPAYSPDSSVYQAKLIGWALVVYGTSHHPYTADTSTAAPGEPIVDNHIPPPAVTMQYDSIPNQNILRARFLHSDSKAVRIGPCQRPVQMHQQPFYPAENSVARYSINELPTVSGKGKDSVLLDNRDSKEGSSLSTELLSVVIEAFWIRFFHVRIESMI